MGNRQIGIMVCSVDVLWGDHAEFINIIHKLKQTFQTEAKHSQAFTYISI